MKRCKGYAQLLRTLRIASNETLIFIKYLKQQGGCITVEIITTDSIESFLDSDGQTLYETSQTDEILFRVDTVQKTFEGSFRGMKRNSYDETVKKIGETMGRNFANDFIFELLRKKNKIPKNFEVFANLWAGFDSKAGFGDIFIDEFSEEKKQIAITIVDSFLVRKTGDDHRSCGFMVGYIKGILDEGFKEYYRWALEIDYLKIPGRVFEVSRVDHSGTGQLCKFDVQLKEEELTETFDIYSKCKKAYYEGRFDDVIFLARVTIEICLRERIGLPRDSRVSTFKILGILKKKKVATVDFEEIKSLYSSLSKVIHSSKKSDKQYCSNVIDILSNIVHSVNRIDLSVSEWNEIRKEALGDRDYSLDQ